MKLYSFDDIKYLKEHYLPKVLNKIADEKTALRITSIEIKEYKKDFYDLSCSGYFINNASVIPIVSIQSVCEVMGLDYPDVVLQNRDL